MAHARMHTRNDSGVSVHSVVTHDQPPSPTLTNPDMIIPIPPWERQRSSLEEGPHPLLEPQIPLSQTISHSTSSSARNSGLSAADVGIATAVLMPSRGAARPPSTIQGASTPIPTYTGYEHGAPLSDIYEESEATATPKSSRMRTRTPSPSSEYERDGSTTPTRQPLRHKKRISSLSNSSSDGSDVGDWEDFDSSKVLSSRVAADLAQLKREETLEVDDGDVKSRRQSREEEELAALNARAEKILENARKRLTHMEDNLKTARNSIFMPANRSPNIGGEVQPVGGLYRSISAAGATKLGKARQGILPIRTSASLQHMRGASDAGVQTSSLKRLSMKPESRSASALEYGSPSRYSLFPDPNNSTLANRAQPSPASTRSYNSPLRILEEERASPSTAETTPESVKAPAMRGLGILNSAAAISGENLATPTDRSASRSTPTPTQLLRSTSSGSVRSTKELKDQMTDLKTRIADLKTKAQSENLKRRSFQGARSSSPFTNTEPEQWYALSPAYGEANSPINASAGVGYRSQTSPATRSAPKPEVQVLNPDGQREEGPITPANQRFLDVDQMTPGTESRYLSSARTDRNTPSLARKDKAVVEQDEDANDERYAVDSVLQSHYEDASSEQDEAEDREEDEQIAENDEEQIYLNEVLEESLRDAEVEPEVPPIPGSYLEDGEEGPEAERHEDRLDAFDYENMFLHSAMGTYTGKSLNGSDSDSDGDSTDDGSIETSRADAQTPTVGAGDVGEEGDIEVEPNTDDEMKHVMAAGEGLGLVQASPSEPMSTGSNQTPPKTPTKHDFPQTTKPWAHTRSQSNDSVSTSATFETATEGEGQDDTPDEILNWNPMPSSSLGYSPTPHQTYGGSRNSPMSPRRGLSSPGINGRTTPVAARSPAVSSPLRHNQHFEVTYDQGRALQAPGSGLGVIGGENAQYINDNGIPERFQGKPSPTHSRQSSLATTQQGKFRPDSQATITPASPAKGHQRQKSSLTLPSSPLTPGNVSRGSPVIVTLTNSPQRKVVINRALQRPESYTLEPSMTGPPNAPLPTPPASSAALQAQMASPKKIDVKRSGSTSKRLPPTPQSTQQQQPPQIQTQQGQPQSLSMIRENATSAPALPQAMPNTEILMESLIKLADPDFSLAPGIRFDETDKNLVLGLLGAVGGVCNSILRASVQSGKSPEVGREKTTEMVKLLRRRLEGATDTLHGRYEEREKEVAASPRPSSETGRPRKASLREFQRQNPFGI